MRRPRSPTSYRLAFKGFLVVRLMEFDYIGKHYSYHGRKLMEAVNRLPFDGNFPAVPSTVELVVWGQAVHDWKELARGGDKTDWRIGTHEGAAGPPQDWRR